MSRRRFSPRLLRLLLVLLVALAMLAAGFAWFVAGLPRAAPDGTTRTDAIVVLTGGSDRIATGVALLRAGLAERLFISGVAAEASLAQVVRQAGFGPIESECCILLGHTARDTIGNARETAQWMRREGYRSLRLVTAHYHMPRSLRVFEHAMPEVSILPHPVFPSAVKSDRWWRWPGTTRLLVQEYGKFLAALVWTAFAPAAAPADRG